MELPVRIKRKTKNFVSCCPTLDIHSQGKTKKEAIYNIIEAISLFLITCFEKGTLEAVLKEREDGNKNRRGVIYKWIISPNVYDYLL